MDELRWRQIIKCKFESVKDAVYAGIFYAVYCKEVSEGYIEVADLDDCRVHVIKRSDVIHITPYSIQ